MVVKKIKNKKKKLTEMKEKDVKVEKSSNKSKILTISIIIFILISVIIAVIFLTKNEENSKAANISNPTNPNPTNPPTTNPPTTNPPSGFEKLSIDWFEYFDKTGNIIVPPNIVPDLRCYVDKSKFNITGASCASLIVGDNQKGNFCSIGRRGTLISGSLLDNPLITLEQAKQICENEPTCNFFNYRIDVTRGHYELRLFKELNDEDFRVLQLTDNYDEELSGSYAKKSSSNQLINISELVD